MPMRYGVHRPLEDQANEILRTALKGVTKHSEKADILTPWKEAERHRREVYPSSGTPDPSVRSGMFHRRTNSARPELNSRDGLAGARADSLAALQAHVMEHGDYIDWTGGD